jgi:hypothetical protein
MKNRSERTYPNGNKNNQENKHTQKDVGVETKPAKGGVS